MPSTSKNQHSTPVATTIADLQARWELTTTVERAESVRQVLAQAQLSRRALARQLNIDEGTVRRYLDIAALSDCEKQQIAAGKSANSVLSRAKELRQQAERHRWQVEESHSGIHSLELAAEITAWLAELPLWPQDTERILNIVRQRLWQLRSKLAGVRPSGLPLAQLIAESKPAERPAVLWLEQYIEWLVRWLIRRCPDCAILDRALEIAANGHTC